MSAYEDAYWSEVNADDSPLERARADADLREQEHEDQIDRLRRDDPVGREALRGWLDERGMADDDVKPSLWDERDDDEAGEEQ